MVFDMSRISVSDDTPVAWDADGNGYRAWKIDRIYREVGLLGIKGTPSESKSASGTPESLESHGFTTTPPPQVQVVRLEEQVAALQAKIDSDQKRHREFRDRVGQWFAGRVGSGDLSREEANAAFSDLRLDEYSITGEYEVTISTRSGTTLGTARVQAMNPDEAVELVAGSAVGAAIARQVCYTVSFEGVEDDITLAETLSGSDVVEMDDDVLTSWLETLEFSAHEVD